MGVYKKAKKSIPKTGDILDALDNYFPMIQHVRFRELDVELAPSLESPISGRSSFSRIDYWVMQIMGSSDPRRGNCRDTYSIEVKIDRSDFTSELRNPQKQRWALMYSNWFYYCAPVGLIKPNELPPYAGLLEFENGKIDIRIRAPFREAEPPRWAFVASLLNAAFRARQTSSSAV